MDELTIITGKVNLDTTYLKIKIFDLKNYLLRKSLKTKIYNHKLTLKMPRCKNCKNKFEVVRFNQKFCLEPECVRVWVESEKAKQWKEKKQKMQQDLETIQDYVKMTQIIFNKFIRLRDKGQVCISCQKPPLKRNCGHFFNANNHWNVRFDERNCHLQCEHCNTYLSGNLIEYQRNLIHKIGIESYHELEAEARKTRKFTKDELKEIIIEYKQKVKKLENESKH